MKKFVFFVLTAFICLAGCADTGRVVEGRVIEYTVHVDRTGDVPTLKVDVLLAVTLNGDTLTEKTFEKLTVIDGDHYPELVYRVMEDGTIANASVYVPIGSVQYLDTLMRTSTLR